MRPHPLSALVTAIAMGAMLRERTEDDLVFTGGDDLILAGEPEPPRRLESGPRVAADFAPSTLDLERMRRAEMKRARKAAKRSTPAEDAA